VLGRLSGHHGEPCCALDLGAPTESPGFAHGVAWCAEFFEELEPAAGRAPIDRARYSDEPSVVSIAIEAFRSKATVDIQPDAVKHGASNLDLASVAARDHQASDIEAAKELSPTVQVDVDDNAWPIVKSPLIVPVVRVRAAAEEQHRDTR
jgi:hypothetical protein